MATQVELSRYGFKWFINAIVGQPEINTTITTSIVSTGTTAVTTEEVLWTYNLPADTLSVNGRGVRITAWGSNGANANTKISKITFGATTVVTSGALAGDGGWRISAEVLRVSASAQSAMGLFFNSFPAQRGGLFTAPASNTAAAITITVTGQNGTAVANDIVIKGVVVELI